MKYDSNNKTFYFDAYDMGDAANAIESGLLTAYYGYKEGQEIRKLPWKLKEFVDKVLTPAAFVEADSIDQHRPNYIKYFNDPCGYFQDIPKSKNKIKQPSNDRSKLKIEQLAEVLLKKSKQRKIEWVVSAMAQTFDFYTTHGSITISDTTKWNANPTERCFSLYICKNDSTEVIDSLVSVLDQSTADILEELYRYARAKALNADTIIDELIKELGE